MPRKSYPEIYKKRKEYIVNKVNKLHSKGFRTTFAFKLVADHLFLSVRTVETIYYSKD